MIGGNTEIQLQWLSGTTTTEYGTDIEQWETMHNLTGWLDFTGGEAGNASFNAKIQESTHVFVCDYVALDSRINAENSRVIDAMGLEYEVKLIDDPMNLHKQLEIYLKLTGGQ